tara:strand:+ start:3604 stop:4062 length:459 start_codon:yes stop_codon:yes gene_type:complete
MKYIGKKRLNFILISIFIFLLDQFSKYLISIDIFNIINKEFFLFTISYIKNYGAAFNIFSGNRIFLSLVSCIFSSIIIYLIIRKKETKIIDLYSYTFILGGTVGNGFDRIFKGYVIDFINLNFINFPVFNFADLSINIGFILILYNLITTKK